VGKATASRLVAWPNKPGILSSFAELTVDVRHESPELADRMRRDVMDAVSDGAARARVEAEIASTWKFGDEVFDKSCIALLREAATSLGARHREIKSQAGHDAYYMSRVAPTAMLFSPCIDGITHNEAEDVPRDETLLAANVLANAVIARADRT
jgi:N-carbamoyl-L-amino-acid hydrolase